MFTKDICIFILINSLSSIFLINRFNYILKQDYIKTKDINSKLNFLLNRFHHLQQEINELNKTLDFLDEKISEKDNIMRQSNELTSCLSNKFDKYIISNYDEIN